MFTMFSVYEISSGFRIYITEFSIYHWYNGVENFSCKFRKTFAEENTKKSEGNDIRYCESVFLVVFFVIILAKFRPIEFFRSNREQLHYVHFAYSPLFYLSLHQYFLFFYFFYKNIISRSPFFTWLFSTFLSTNFLKFIVKKDWMNR